MVHDLLDLAQVKAGKFSLTMESFNLHDLILQLVVLMNFQAEQKGIQLKQNFDNQISNQIYSDPNRLRQIILNLVGNSLKFTKKGSITIKAQQISQKVIRINIIDTGIGIKDEDKGKLFSAFGKIEGKESNQLNPSGVGLGLMISHILAQNLGDQEGQKGEGLKVESIFGQGTEFYFEIINNTHLMKQDKSLIFKSGLVKSQYHKKSIQMSQITQQQGDQNDKFNANKQRNSLKKDFLDPKMYEMNDQIKTFGKIESKQETNIQEIVDKNTLKKDDIQSDESDSQNKSMANSTLVQINGQIQVKHKNQLSFTSNTLSPTPPQIKVNSLVSFTQVDNHTDQQTPQINPTIVSHQRLSMRNSFNVIQEEESEYEGDGSASTPQQKKGNTKQIDSPLSLEDQLLQNLESQYEEKFTIDQIGPKTKLQPCSIQAYIQDERINSEGNITINRTQKKKNNENFNCESDNQSLTSERDSPIQKKKIIDLSDLLQVQPQKQVVSNVYNNFGKDKQISNIEDLHDSTSSEEDHLNSSNESNEQNKKQNQSIEKQAKINKNSNHESSASKQVKKMPEELNKNIESYGDLSMSLQNMQLSKTNEKEKNKKTRTAKRYKTKIKRSSSQVEFLDNNHRSISQSMSGSVQQQVDILTIDDNHFNNMVLKMHIERLTTIAKVICASDGSDALEKLKEQYKKTKGGYALIFLDLSMPQMDGYETFAEIQKFCKQQKIEQNVVACTGYSNAEEKDKCIDVGMVDYIIKPIEVHKLKEVLSLFLENYYDEN